MEGDATQHTRKASGDGKDTLDHVRALEKQLMVFEAIYTTDKDSDQSSCDLASDYSGSEGAKVHGWTQRLGQPHEAVEQQQYVLGLAARACAIGMLNSRFDDKAEDIKKQRKRDARRQSKPREYAGRIVSDPRFGSAILVLIILNSITLAMDSPDLKSNDAVQDFLAVSEWFFNILFLLEAILKITAWGCFTKGVGYFRTGWNWLDFAIVCVGVADVSLPLVAGVDAANISGLRLLRILRPLRTLSRLDGMRSIVETLAMSLPMIGDVFLLLLFLILVFAILGIQLWSATLHQRCYVPLADYLELYPIDDGNSSGVTTLDNITAVQENLAALAGEGLHYLEGAPYLVDKNDTSPCSRMAGGRHCANDFASCLSLGVTLQTRFINFDHMGSALLFVFKGVSLDDWPQDLWLLMDTYTAHVWFYFVLLVLSSSYFAVNLFLAVLSAIFTRNKAPKECAPIPGDDGEEAEYIPVKTRKLLKKRMKKKSTYKSREKRRSIVPSVVRKMKGSSSGIIVGDAADERKKKGKPTHDHVNNNAFAVLDFLKLIQGGSGSPTGGGDGRSRAATAATRTSNSHTMGTTSPEFVKTPGSMQTVPMSGGSPLGRCDPPPALEPRGGGGSGGALGVPHPPKAPLRSLLQTINDLQNLRPLHQTQSGTSGIAPKPKTELYTVLKRESGLVVLNGNFSTVRATAKGSPTSRTSAPTPPQRRRRSSTAAFSLPPAVERGGGPSRPKGGSLAASTEEVCLRSQGRGTLRSRFSGGALDPVVIEEELPTGVGSSPEGGQVRLTPSFSNTLSPTGMNRSKSGSIRNYIRTRAGSLLSRKSTYSALSNADTDDEGAPPPQHGDSPWQDTACDRTQTTDMPAMSRAGSRFSLHASSRGAAALGMSRSHTSPTGVHNRSLTPSHNSNMLTVPEVSSGGGGAAGAAPLRRHSVVTVTSCVSPALPPPRPSSVMTVMSVGSGASFGVQTCLSVASATPGDPSVSTSIWGTTGGPNGVVWGDRPPGSPSRRTPVGFTPSPSASPHNGRSLDLIPNASVAISLPDPEDDAPYITMTPAADIGVSAGADITFHPEGGGSGVGGLHPSGTAGQALTARSLSEIEGVFLEQSKKLRKHGRRGGGGKGGRKQAPEREDTKRRCWRGGVCWKRKRDMVARGAEGGSISVPILEAGAPIAAQWEIALDQTVSLFPSGEEGEVDSQDSSSSGDELSLESSRSSKGKRDYFSLSIQQMKCECRKDVLRCRDLCVSKDFGGFTVFEGTAFFFANPGEDCCSKLVYKRGARTHLVTVWEERQDSSIAGYTDFLIPCFELPMVPPVHRRLREEKGGGDGEAQQKQDPLSASSSTAGSAGDYPGLGPCLREGFLRGYGGFSVGPDGVARYVNQTSEVIVDHLVRQRGGRVYLQRARVSWRVTVKALVENPIFEGTMLAVTILNVLALAADHEGIDSTVEMTIELINTFCTAFFGAEVLLKIMGLGFWGMWSDNYNKFDTILVVIGVPQLLFSFIAGGSEGGNFLSVFRMLRAARVLRLGRRWKRLRDTIQTVIASLAAVVYLSLLLLLFLFIYSVLGMQLFGEASGLAAQRLNFTSLFGSLLTVFVIVSGEGWATVMKDTMASSGWPAAFYFVSLFVIGRYIILNLFIAIIIEKFQDNGAKHALKRRRRKRRMSRQGSAFGGMRVSEGGSGCDTHISSTYFTGDQLTYTTSTMSSEGEANCDTPRHLQRDPASPENRIAGSILNRVLNRGNGAIGGGSSSPGHTNPALGSSGSAGACRNPLADSRLDAEASASVETPPPAGSITPCGYPQQQKGARQRVGIPSAGGAGSPPAVGGCDSTPDGESGRRIAAVSQKLSSPDVIEALASEVELELLGEEGRVSSPTDAACSGLPSLGSHDAATTHATTHATLFSNALVTQSDGGISPRPTPQPPQCHQQPEEGRCSPMGPNETDSERASHCGTSSGGGSLPSEEGLRQIFDPAVRSGEGGLEKCPSSAGSDIGSLDSELCANLQEVYSHVASRGCHQDVPTGADPQGETPQSGKSESGTLQTPLTDASGSAGAPKSQGVGVGVERADPSGGGMPHHSDPWEGLPVGSMVLPGGAGQVSRFGVGGREVGTPPLAPQQGSSQCLRQGMAQGGSRLSWSVEGTIPMRVASDVTRSTGRAAQNAEGGDGSLGSAAGSPHGGALPPPQLAQRGSLTLDNEDAYRVHRDYIAADSSAFLGDEILESSGDDDDQEVGRGGGGGVSEMLGRMPPPPPPPPRRRGGGGGGGGGDTVTTAAGMPPDQDTLMSRQRYAASAAAEEGSEEEEEEEEEESQQQQQQHGVERPSSSGSAQEVEGGVVSPRGGSTVVSAEQQCQRASPAEDTAHLDVEGATVVRRCSALTTTEGLTDADNTTANNRTLLRGRGRSHSPTVVIVDNSEHHSYDGALRRDSKLGRRGAAQNIATTGFQRDGSGAGAAGNGFFSFQDVRKRSNRSLIRGSMSALKKGLRKTGLNSTHATTVRTDDPATQTQDDPVQSAPDTPAVTTVVDATAFDQSEYEDDLGSTDNWVTGGPLWFGERTLYLFPANGCVRTALTPVVTSLLFERVVVFAIVVNLIILSLAAPAIQDKFPGFFYWSDVVFTSLFVMEMVAKVIVFGAWHTRYAYVRDLWNLVDIVVVFTSVLGLFCKFFVIFRSFRVFRLITRSNNAKVVLYAAVGSVPSVLNGLSVCAFVFVLFAVMGVQLLKGDLVQCTNPAIKLQSECNGTFTEYDADSQPTVREAVWVTSEANYNNIFTAIFSLFKIAMSEEWVFVMFAAIDSVNSSEGPVEDARPLLAIYFIFFYVMASFLCLNLIISILIATFSVYHEARFIRSHVEDKDPGSRYGGWVADSERYARVRHMILTEGQKKWVRSQQLLAKDVHFTAPPQSRWRRKVHKIVFSHKFEYCVSVVIALNLIMLCTQHRNQSAVYNDVFEKTNYVFISFYTIECAMKVTGLTWKGYWKDNWSRFDFVVLFVSYLGIVMGESLTFFRIFRIGRLLRLFHLSKGLSKMFTALLYALPPLLNIGLLLACIFFVYGVLGVESYGRLDLELNPELGRNLNFRDLPEAALLLFQVSTGELWLRTLQGIRVQPPQCTPPHCGNEWAIVYLVSFMVIVSFLMVNLFVAVTLEAFQDAEQVLDKDYLVEAFHEYRRKWLEITCDLNDPQGGKDSMHVDVFVKLLKDTPPPIGPIFKTDSVVLHYLVYLNIPVDRRLHVSYNDAVAAFQRKVYKISKEKALQLAHLSHVTISNNRFTVAHVLYARKISELWLKHIEQKKQASKQQEVQLLAELTAEAPKLVLSTATRTEDVSEEGGRTPTLVMSEQGGVASGANSDAGDVVDEVDDGGAARSQASPRHHPQHDHDADHFTPFTTVRVRRRRAGSGLPSLPSYAQESSRLSSVPSAKGRHHTRTGSCDQELTSIGLSDRSFDAYAVC